jgi:zinc transport system ATP-binding protein
MDGNLPMSTPAICIRDLTFSYDGTPVIEHAELCVDEGNFVSIVGPNGGGKTTILKLMLGLLRPTEGSVAIFGKKPEDARREIGYVPQKPLFDPHFPISVRDVVLTGRLGTPGGIFRSGSKDREVAHEALAEVELERMGDAPFYSLSGGQQQRALIARALASRPRMLLLDEPTAGLDRIVESRLYRLLRSLTKRLTVVLVSHDLGFVSKFVDRVVCVNREVHIHPTSDLSSDLINELYGTDVKLVRHDVSEPEVHHE